ncbi:hypothetical protein B0H19DRAFT_1275596 [Mycena capillaripes]|nr:hypothetical protein B0H19DRAFT_1275596 [Mycena capillaripes]
MRNRRAMQMPQRRNADALPSPSATPPMPPPTRDANALAAQCGRPRPAQRYAPPAATNERKHPAPTQPRAMQTPRRRNADAPAQPGATPHPPPTTNANMQPRELQPRPPRHRPYRCFRARPRRRIRAAVPRDANAPSPAADPAASFAPTPAADPTATFAPTPAANPAAASASAPAAGFVPLLDSVYINTCWVSMYLK